MTQEQRANAQPGRPSRRPAREIDENLRRVYQQTVEEEIPDKLQALIEQLRKQDERS